MQAYTTTGFIFVQVSSGDRCVYLLVQIQITDDFDQRFLSAANRLASISKSSSGGADLGVPSLDGCVRDEPSSSVGGISGSFGVLAPVLLASADIVAASGRGESNAVAIFSDCSRRTNTGELGGV